jgi:hypothetical protein
MTQSRLILIFIVLTVIVTLSAGGLYAYTLKSTPTSVENLEKQIAEESTQVEELQSYSVIQNGYIAYYPQGWDLRFDAEHSILHLDPPGEDPNPYGREQGQFTNPSDDISIQAMTLPNVLAYITTAGTPLEQIERTIVHNHSAFIHSPHAMSLTRAYLINIIDDLYIEVSSEGDMANLETILNNLKIVYPKPNPNLEMQKSTQDTTNTISIAVTGQNYYINMNASWHMRYSEDPDDTTVTIDPPGEGSNPYSDASGEWTNPSDDIVLEKVTISDLDQFMVDNMIPTQTVKPLMIEDKQAWLMTSGDGESVIYMYLIKLDDTKYLKVSTIGSVETLATIALKLSFK